MTIIRLKTLVCNPTDTTRCTEVEAIVDTGSFYTWIPKSEAERVGIPVLKEQVFKTISGQRIVRRVGIAACEAAGSKAGCNIVFGEDGDGTVLGSEALESLGLKIDPRSGSVTKEDSMLAL